MDAGLNINQIPPVDLQHVDKAAAAPVKSETEVLSPVNEKTKAQGSVLSKKMEAKLDKLTGKNIEQMSSKEVGKHLKKCNREAAKINKFIVKKDISDLSTSQSFSKFAAHTGNAIQKGSQVLFGADVNMKTFERSATLKETMGRVDSSLGINEMKPAKYKELTEKEVIDLYEILVNIDATNTKQVEDILSDNHVLSQLNSFIRESDCDKLGITEPTKKALETLTHYASRMPNWQENLKSLNEKVESGNGELSANEAWLLDHIEDVQAIFSSIDKGNIKDCPILSALGSNSFSKENIAYIAKHRNQNFQVGDVILFNGAKYRAYKGHETSTRDHLHQKLTGSDVAHAELISMKTQDGTIENKGLWDNGMKAYTTDVGISYYSDGYRLNLKQLITPKLEKALKDAGVKDIPTFLQEKYATSFSNVAKSDSQNAMINSGRRRILSIIPRILNKKMSIEELVQSNQKKAICSEHSLVTTYKAMSELKNDLKKFCDEKGTGAALVGDDIVSFDMKTKN